MIEDLYWFFGGFGFGAVITKIIMWKLKKDGKWNNRFEKETNY